MSIARQTDFNAHFNYETLFATERNRIVRLCAHLTGDANAAEDLAQEAMIEAWRTAMRLDDPAAFSSWLSGCARNVCRRWSRSHGRELAHRAPITIETAEAVAHDAMTDPASLDLELERDDLATLLDRALTLLPPDTREALIGHYIDQRSQAEIADLLGSSENAISVRLHRGRIAFRKALNTPELRPLSASFGLLNEGEIAWQETRIWCHECGNRRLIAYFSEDRSIFQIKCPDCQPYSNLYTTNVSGVDWLLGDLSAIKPAYTRSSDYMVRSYSRFLNDGVAHCLNCGAETPLLDGTAEFLPEEYQSIVAKHYICQSCGSLSDSSLSGLVIFLPELRAFRRDNPRIRRIPDRFIEVAGREAVVTAYESITTGTTIEVVSARDNFRTLSINGEAV